jgi:hypothetical protein
MEEDWAVPAGYSGTPLPTKLGIKPGSRLAVVDAPAGFVEHVVPADVTVSEGVGYPVDLALLFVSELAALVELLPVAQAATEPDGAFWVCWPKRASKVDTDITEDRIRDVALPRGLVDNKVCSVSATWSGLRLCLRRELRRPH